MDAAKFNTFEKVDNILKHVQGCIDMGKLEKANESIVSVILLMEDLKNNGADLNEKEKEKIEENLEEAKNQNRLIAQTWIEMGLSS